MAHRRVLHRAGANARGHSGAQGLRASKQTYARAVGLVPRRAKPSIIRDGAEESTVAQGTPQLVRWSHVHESRVGSMSGFPPLVRRYTKNAVVAEPPARHKAKPRHADVGDPDEDAAFPVPELHATERRPPNAETPANRKKKKRSQMAESTRHTRRDTKHRTVNDKDQPQKGAMKERRCETKNKNAKEEMRGRGHSDTRSQRIRLSGSSPRQIEDTAAARRPQAAASSETPRAGLSVNARKAR
ncbi:hypothetical protein C8R47DRAFT_1068717 [Mycena vitilis]|nr:hypothetical protein C8R47DRAFT_1068717 [Mycena vitilis]